ncbi:PTS glucose transporter subunit IIA [Thermobifida alba]|uniref:PTS glucose transporter subunit IIA n=1 Tax=Thermobifida alba TaxID=53522 RepID=A0ABY4L209_THEAE|nr:PTS glucose transporter subunit IIA [Thermobifida alba]UPT21705.1 PTS glucose transporter subunit IIA [Thermobifida alba]HLU97936.1 PTS glucose transporter subunit IIA [Thermobifida alba]
MLAVLAPVTGVAVGLARVPEPTFAQGLVGPGTAIDPRRELQEAVAPITGRIVSFHPHAFVVRSAHGKGVLVHLGINTVRLPLIRGFELLAAQGQDVTAGQPLIRWNPAEVVASGVSPIVPIVALDADGDVISRPVSGEVRRGALLFRWA